TVLRTSEGDLEYPGYVPAEVESPEANLKSPGASLGRPASISAREPDKASDDTSELKARRSMSHNFSSIHPVQSSPLGDRPKATRQWQTELPDAHARGWTRPAATKDRSYLGKAMREGNEMHMSELDGSSSSSSDSEEDEPISKPADKAGSRKHGPRRRERTAAERRMAAHESGRFNVGNENYNTKGKVKKDGRLEISVKETANTGYIAKALGSAMHKFVSPDEGDHSKRRLSTASTETPDIGPRPRINIVIMVIGSRGDIQPFVRIGKVLETYGHRVRIATHPAFRDFVEKDSGLEFFSVGGDPSELMAFMVKNPGMIPKLETVKAGDIGRRRAQMAEMFDGFWRACINATDDEKDSHNLKMMGDKTPFVADAIIANPPSFAHVHCAEALGIPTMLINPFPYHTPTQSFPHPLASIKRSNVDPGYTNFISYPIIETMVWSGLGDLVNNFRVKTLCLDPVSTLWAPGSLYRMKVPTAYIWSPGLLPKPADWGSEIDVAGFVFLDLASSFTPPTDLEKFLNAGEKPIYIGFGSIVVDDADAFTQMIFEAVKLSGVRALVSKGWGGLGGENVPDNIFMLENTPHDWLFPRVSACVIHGGAGTVAIALKCGKPTMVCPFFGDQHFWGQVIGTAGAGPEAVPYKSLNAEKLAEGIEFCLTEEAQQAADELAKSIELEGDGAENAVKSFHKHLSLNPPNSMRCSIFRDRIAAWKPKDSHIKLSPLAADMLVQSGHLTWKRVRLHRHMEWNDFEGPGEPLTGVAGSLATSVSNVFGGIGGVPKRMHKTTKKRKELEKEAAGGTDDVGPGDSKATTTGAISNGSANGPRHTDTQPMTTEEAAEEYVGDVTSGFGQTATAIAKAPVDLSMALAQGFHNAPRLYGDDTVRRPVRVTGIRSGLKAARKEFGYGVYDGFTGVVRLPVRGAKQDGAVGFVKGTGMGLMGLVLKNMSAVVSPVGYTLKGVVKQAERRRQPLKYIRRGRIVQGQREAISMDEKERDSQMSQALENWALFKELEAEIANGQAQRGIVGQFDKAMLDTKILFEDIDLAKDALAALKSGASLEQVTRDAMGLEEEPKSSDRKGSKSLRSSLNLGSR
ncbi:UDP-Glycosyltransferase/glycogen phosphorylase, partial [Sarocladium strictum]